MVAAIRTASGAAQSSVSTRTPDLPASRFSQKDGTSPPSGVVAPSPVTTTGSLVFNTASVIARFLCASGVNVFVKQL